MKALVYTGPEQLAFQDMPDPVASAGEELVEIEASGICGSDMHGFLGHDERRPPPLILGHEAAGTIASGPRSGQRVVINPLITCGVCQACRQGRTNICAARQIISMPPRHGAFAQYVSMPRRNLIDVPDGVASERAALTEPLACGWHATRLARSLIAEPWPAITALVLGGGAIGLGTALALKAAGVTQISISEPNEERRDRIAAIDGFAVFDPLSKAVPDAASFDLAIDAVGSAATRAAACRFVKPGGAIVHIGLAEGTGGLDIRRMTLQEISFVGTYTYTEADFRDTANALFEGRLGALDWVDIRPLSDGLQAFEDLRDGRVAAPKILLRP